MDALIGLAAVGGFLAIIWLGGRWFRRRFDQVDSYHEREAHRDPPATDASSWPGGREF